MLKTPTYCKLAVLFLFTFIALKVVSAELKPGTFSYTEKWKEITRPLLEVAPDSVLKKVEVIMKQAKAENNTVQMIKASVQAISSRLYVDPNRAAAQIAGFDSLAIGFSAPSDLAVMRSMEAELFLKYYKTNYYTINNRTAVLGKISGNLEQWTKNMFVDTIRSLLTASLKPAEVLQKTAIKEYNELIDNKSGNWIQPTLFEFLANRKIELLIDLKHFSDEPNFAISPELVFLPADRFVKTTFETNVGSEIDREIVRTYQDWLGFRQDATAPMVLLRADLQRIKSFKSIFSNRTYDYEQDVENGLNQEESAYVKALEQMTVRYALFGEVLYAFLAEANFYQSKYENYDSIRKTYLRKAYDLCAVGIARFPKSPISNELKNLQDDIRQKRMHIRNNDVAKPKTKLDLFLESKNIEGVELKVYRVNTTAKEYYKSSSQKVSPAAVLIESRWISLSPDSNFNFKNTVVPITTKGYGIYEYTLTAKGLPNEPQLGRFVVSDLAYLMQNANKSGCCVVDRVSGKPIPNVQFNAYTTKASAKGTQLEPLLIEQQTDQNGMLNINNLPTRYAQLVVFLEKGADKYYTSQDQYYRNKHWDMEKKEMNVRMFTDRSLYRPGQTVHVKGIAYFMNSDRQGTVSDKSFELMLFDANGAKVSTKTVRTNEFGSFAESFVLPDEGLNGNYSLKVDDSFANFWVEAYKRPSFEVTLERPDAALHFGDSVLTKGKVVSFAGYPVSNATVAYTVVRQLHSIMIYSSRQTHISSGTLKTAADGTFEIPFLAKRMSQSTGVQYYTYKITAIATDQKGETQQGEKEVSVGDRSLVLTSKIYDNRRIDKTKKMTLDVQLTTLNGSPRDGTIFYELHRLEQPKELVNLNDYFRLKKQPGSPVRMGRFPSKEGKLELDLSSEESGSYRIEFFTLDSAKDSVHLFKDFILYNPNDKKPPVKTYEWVSDSRIDCVVGEHAKVPFGSSAKDVHVLYQIMAGDSVLESRWFTISDEIKTLEIPYLSSYGDRVDVLFTFVKDEKLFNHWLMLSKKQEKRTLTPRLTVFRDKLQPGEKAEWTVHIPEVQDQKLKSELMVDMYDASLDALRPHSWRFQPSRPFYMNTMPWRSNISNLYYRNFVENLVKRPSRSNGYRTINWMGLSFESRLAYMRVAGVQVRDGRGMELVSLDAMEENPVYSMGSTETILKEVAVARQGRIAEPKIAVRENFNETAFFYPQLHTDEQGNVRFSFIVPESLTRWQFKMLAHTKNLYTGYADTTLVTQKDLMVQLNMPRFVRRSDKLVLRASVVNLTDTVQRTKVRLTVFDPATEKVLPLKDSLIRMIELKGRGTKFVEWTLTEFAPYELVACKVIAYSETFSDGEQRYLPVLPDQILLTESLPMTVRVNQNKSFTFDALKKADRVDSKSLTVEFSPNPAWYAVQALPSISVPESKNVLDNFTAYYVNSLASHIAQANPKLTDVFDQWKLAGNSKEALLSNLEKNKELKSMLLEETPWVLAAQNETQQKRQIALLFDRNQQKQQNSRYWEEVRKLQLPSGGFTWFTGFSEDRFLTQFILLNTARLNKMLQSDAPTMDDATSKALEYADNELTQDFNRLKKQHPTYKTSMNIGDMQWFYLHVRSEYPQVPIPAFAREAVAYFTEQAEKYWTNATLYGKAATALIASRNKKSKLATEILSALKSTALKSEDMGMYWARNTPGYFWSQRPVFVQTMILEAFAEVGKNPADLNEIKIWLLRQKQTQRWDSPLSTVDAIYALLHNGSDWISSDNRVSIQLDAKKVEVETKEAGTGYFKQVVAGKNVKTGMERVDVALKGNSGFGWGALYWQYYQNQDQVQQSGSGLSINKKLYVEQVLPTGKAMMPIDKVTLKKGDKVITRLVVSVDRDLEYVALKDLRAACLEPTVQQSGCAWKEGVCYYHTIKDASTQFFFSSLPKGNYVFEYETWVNTAGTFTSGVTTLQCLYAPECSAHSNGEKIVVSEK